MSVPPQLMAMLAHAQAGNPPGAAVGPPSGLLEHAMASGMPSDPENAQTSRDQPIQILQQMISLAKQYIDAEQDQEDVHTMAKVLATLQKYLAEEQKTHDEALGGGNMKVLRKLG